jgi:chromosome segregation ATPase
VLEGQEALRRVQDELHASDAARKVLEAFSERQAGEQAELQKVHADTQAELRAAHATLAAKESAWEQREAERAASAVVLQEALEQLQQEHSQALAGHARALGDADASLSELRSRVAHLEDAQREAKQADERMQAHLQSAQAEAAELKAKLAQQSAALALALAEKQQALDTAQAARRQLDSTRSELLTTQRAEAEDMQQAVHRLEEENLHLQLQLASVQAAHGRLEQTAAEQEAALQARLAEQAAAAARAQQRYEEASRTIQELQDALTTKRKAANSAAEAQAQLQAQLQTAERQHEAKEAGLQQQLRELELRLVAAREQGQQALSQVQALRLDVERLQAESHREKQALLETRMGLDEARFRHARELADLRDASAAEVEAVQELYNEELATCEGLRSALEAAAEESQALKGQLEAGELREAMLRRQLEGVQAVESANAGQAAQEKAAAQQALATLQQKYDRALQLAAEHEAQLRLRTQQLEAVQAELDETHGTLADAIVQLEAADQRVQELQGKQSQVMTSLEEVRCPHGSLGLGRLGGGGEIPRVSAPLPAGGSAPQGARACHKDGRGPPRPPQNGAGGGALAVPGAG